MSTSWVSIRSHGVVKIEPLPEFGKEFVNILLPPAPLKTNSVTSSDIPRQPDFGKELFREPAGPVRDSAFLMEKVLDTCLEDSNLVGNIYFSNYYTWQGRIRDHFLYEIAPEYFTDSEKLGELRCVRCQISHLGEAMPYDRIAVRMYKSAVYEKGICFYFDFFKIAVDGNRQKLGFGVHEGIWHVSRSGHRGKWIPSKLPQKLLSKLIPKNNLEIHNAPSRGWTKKNNLYDVIVVGAGMGGLTTASLLTKKGMNVLVVEKHNKPGGFCTSFERLVTYKKEQVKFVFDAGVHDIFGLGPGGIVRKLLKEMDIEKQIEWRRVDHQYIFPDLQIKVPRGFKEYVDLLCTSFPKERRGLYSFFNEIKQCYYDYFSPNSTRKNLSCWSNISFNQLVDSFINDKRLKKLLSVLCYYLTDDITNVMSQTMIPIFGYYIDGGHYPIGGSQVLPNLLATEIKKNGGDILFDTAVSKIIIDNNNIFGVELADGKKLQSKIVVSNADLRRTFLDLINPGYLPPYYLNQIKGLKPSNSAFLVSLGVNFIPDIEPVTTIMEGEEHLIIMIPSKLDPSLANKGHSVISLLRLISNDQAITWNRDNKGYYSRKKKMGNNLISYAEKIIPNLKNHIIYREEASPATFARYGGTSDGTIYGTRLDEWKPAVKTPIQGLYLASASISPRPSVADAVNAGMLASKAILRDENNILSEKEMMNS